MFNLFERMVAFRYLRARKAEGFVSVIAAFSFLGIMLGVATLIIVMSVMNGFRAELISRILGLNGHVNAYHISGSFRDYTEAQNKILHMDGVKAVYPMIEKQALLSAENISAPLMVRGLTQDSFANKDVLGSSLKSGELANFHGFSIMIGTEIAERFRLDVGDVITLTAPQGRSSPFGSLPIRRSFKIAGIFDVEMYEYNNGFAFIPLEAAQKFYRMNDAVNILEIVAENASDSKAITDKTKDALSSHFRVKDWSESNGSFFNALQVERNVMFLILTLIIIVAAFNIISSMIMLVKDKGRDIAILRTMGAPRRSILKLFILTGSCIGFVGTFAGSVLGIAFAVNIEGIRRWLESLTGTELFAAEIYFLSQLPAKIDWGETGAVIIMAFTISLLATLYPAWRAARMDPVEVLRYE